jgi:tripartite-type tricarboxylate transporter receptor subunit TctC
MNHVTLAVGSLLLAVAISGARTVDAAYPDRPIRLIIPFVPGGPSDILSRLLGAKLSEQVGQQVVPDNRGSAGGVLGFELGAKALPDGYTMTMAAYSGLTINPHVYKKLPYDPQKDFQPITQLTTGGNVLVVNPAVAATSVKEFIALAKASPGKLNYATTGTGNVLGTAQLELMAGIKMTAIPYKGTGQAILSLMSNEVQMFIMNPLVAIPNVKAGKLRGLGVTSLTRNPVLPDLPTVSEAGVPGFENVTWHSFVFPAGIPKPILTRMHKELVTALNRPDVKDVITGQGLTPVGSSTEELVALIKKESAKYKKLVKDINFEPI